MDEEETLSPEDDAAAEGSADEMTELITLPEEFSEEQTEPAAKKRRPSKKAILTAVISVAAFVVIAVSGVLIRNAVINKQSAPTAEYPYDFVGLYDNITRQHIEIGDSKEQIERIFGSGERFEDSSIFDYDDELSIRYDDDNNVMRIRVFNSWGDFDDNPERYELPNDINLESIVTDFMDSFSYVYEGTDGVLDNVAAYVEETPDGYISLSKEYIYEKQAEYENTQNDDSLTDEEIDEFLDKQNPIYKLSIAYNTYEDIEYIEIDAISAYEVPMIKFSDSNQSSSNISEDTINASKENIEPYLKTLGVITEVKDLTLPADAYYSRNNVELLGVSGSVESGFTTESETQVRYVEWVSNDELSNNEFDEFIQVMNKFENSEYYLTSYDNISPETYVWTDREHSSYVMSWLENDIAYVRWYYEEELLQ